MDGRILQPLPLPQGLHGSRRKHGSQKPHIPKSSPAPQLSELHVAFIDSMRDCSNRAQIRSEILKMVARLCQALTLEQQCSSETLLQAYGPDKAQSIHALSLLEKMQHYHELLSRAPHCVQVTFNITENNVVYHDVKAYQKTVLAVHSNFTSSIRTQTALLPDEQNTWQWSRESRLPRAIHPQSQMLSSCQMFGQLENEKMVREVYTEACRSVWLLSDTTASMQDLFTTMYGVIYKHEATATARLTTQARLTFCIAFAVVMATLRIKVPFFTLQSMPWSWKEEITRTLQETHCTSDTISGFQTCKLLLLCNCQRCKKYQELRVQTYHEYKSQQHASTGAGGAAQVSAFDEAKQANHAVCAVENFWRMYETLDCDARQVIDTWYTVAVGMASCENARQQSKCMCSTCWSQKYEDRFSGFFFKALLQIDALPQTLPLSTKYHAALDEACMELQMDKGQCDISSSSAFCMDVLKIMAWYSEQDDFENIQSLQKPRMLAVKSLRHALCDTVQNSPMLFASLIQVVEFNAISDENMLRDIVQCQEILHLETNFENVAFKMPQTIAMLHPCEQHYRQISTQVQGTGSAICSMLMQNFHPEVIVMYALFLCKSKVMSVHFRFTIEMELQEMHEMQEHESQETHETHVTHETHKTHKTHETNETHKTHETNETHETQVQDVPMQQEIQTGPEIQMTLQEPDLWTDMFGVMSMSSPDVRDTHMLYANEGLNEYNLNLDDSADPEMHAVPESNTSLYSDMTHNPSYEVYCSGSANNATSKVAASSLPAGGAAGAAKATGAAGGAASYARALNPQAGKKQRKPPKKK